MRRDLLQALEAASCVPRQSACRRRVTSVSVPTTRRGRPSGWRSTMRPRSTIQCHWHCTRVEHAVGGIQVQVDLACRVALVGGFQTPGRSSGWISSSQLACLWGQRIRRITQRQQRLRHVGQGVGVDVPEPDTGVRRRSSKTASMVGPACRSRSVIDPGAPATGRGQCPACKLSRRLSGDRPCRSRDSAPRRWWPRRCTPWGGCSTSGIAGLGQNVTPGPCRSLADSSTTALGSLMARSFAVFRPWLSHSAYFGLRPLTMSKNAAWMLGGDGAALAGAELDAVELTDGRHLGGGAGEEGLVG